MMASPETSATATLTPMQLPSPTPLQYQSPVTAANQTQPTVLPPSFTNLAQVGTMYRPVYHHWFFKKEVETKVLWQPFSMVDSLALEEAFTSTDIAPETLVATDGGRYDVNILRRQRSSVYWQESPSEVRRCSWFYKGSADTRYVPYEENICTRLEEEFKIATTTNVWHRRVEFPNGETVVFHGPNVMVHFLQATSPDAWGNTPQTPLRPRVVKRGVDEFDIDEGEPAKVDHLLFLVHGIGSVCDLKFRTVEEVVDDFRSLSLQLVQSHFRTAIEQGKVNRIEVLPISWHATLHGEDTGIDRKLKSITLNSIPKLRHFTNDTLLDILFYTSPVYCQTIMHTVGKELNRLFNLFRERNPTFEGGVSLGGHSLGSLILFDLLYHQKPPEHKPTEEPVLSSREGSTEPTSTDEDKSENTTGKVPPSERKLNQRISYVMGNAGTGQPFITYPQLNFQPKAFFALGSPIGMFVTVRGIETLGEDFCLPTCPGFFNIFHPFDPVAYRIETLVNPELTMLRPVLIPHHKGRKRMHLELKETMARVGADLKQRLMESVRSTWNTVYQLAMFHRSDDQALEHEVDKVLEEQLQEQQQQSETDSCHSGTDGETDPDVCVGQLNGGRRIDFVLQEAPLESFNEYLFALKTHVCYWESEDTMLMILKEVYATMGISADNHVLQQNAPSDRSISVSHSYSDTFMDANGPNTINSVLEEKAKSEFVSNQIDLPQVATYPVDIQSSSVSLSGPSGAITSSYLLSTDVTSESNHHPAVGMDPTVPLTENKSLGPPPMAGFVRK
ncbi:phospholipase DDHD2 isoform X3 [Periplaneta americana]